MDIKVIGSGCEKCNQLYRNVQEAVQQLGLNAQVQKVEDLVEMVQLGVMTSPSVMVDGKLVVSGRVANVKSLVNLLKTQEG